MTDYDRLGKEQERRIVRWAREHGFPFADRIVRTGAGKDYAHRADEGDVWLCPGVVVQSKRLSPPNRAERAVPGWMIQTEFQRAAAKADVALLIVRRAGTADVGEWWCFLPAFILARLLWIGATSTTWARADFPVRLLVSDAAKLLIAAGYGSDTEGAA